MPEAHARRHSVPERSRMPRLHNGRAPLMVVPAFARAATATAPSGFLRVGLAAILGLVGVLVLAGSGGGTYAAWSSRATVTPGTIQTGSIGASVAIHPSLDTTYAPGAFTKTGGLSITNNGTVGARYTTSVDVGNSDSEFLGGLTTYIWKTDSIARCVDSAETPQGTPPVTAFPDGTLAAGATDMYCVRMVFTPDTRPSGTATLQLSTTLTLGGWTSTYSGANTTFSQRYVAATGSL